MAGNDDGLEKAISDVNLLSTAPGKRTLNKVTHISKYASYFPPFYWAIDIRIRPRSLRNRAFPSYCNVSEATVSVYGADGDPAAGE